MVTIVAALLIALDGPSQYPDRAKFLHALKRLPEGTSRAEVEKALGKPDRILRQDDFVGSKSIVDETWFYGTDGPNGAATLARFDVFAGKLAYHPVEADPPPPSVISEAELRKAMHLVLDPIGTDSSATTRVMSMWVAKTVNALLPFGEAKCKAIIGECGRVMEGYAQLDPRPYFLCYSLFDPPNPPGYFDVYGPVWDAPTPTNHLAAPRWPVEIVDNVPMIRGRPMGGFGGYAPSFETTFKELRDRIHLRKSPLSVPNGRP